MEFFKKDYKQLNFNNTLKNYKENEIVKMAVIPTFQITFKQDSGFGAYLAVVAENDNEKEINFKGIFPSELVLGQTYKIKGRICNYKGQKQINVESFVNIKPINKRGIISYLQTLKGLKSKADKIYEKFGDNSIDILIKDPMKVAQSIAGIGKKSVLNWKTQLDEMKENQEILMELMEYGLTSKESRKLLEKHGETIVENIRKNPYSLAMEVKGYGFDKCDRIARNMGFDLRSAFRIQEGIIYALQKATLSGHCFLPKEELENDSKSLLDVRLSMMEMYNVIQDKRLLQEGISLEIKNKIMGNSEIEYIFNEKKYILKKEDIIKSLMACKKEKDNKRKDKYKYKLINITFDEISMAINKLINDGRIIKIDDKIYLKNLYFDERIVEERILSIVENETNLNIDLKNDLNQLLKKKNIVLERKQEEAVLSFSSSIGGFFVLNGNAGCGKTFTLNIILELLEIVYKKQGINLKIKVFAPTGRASKVASKSTKRECATIHRGLNCSGNNKFEYNKNNLLNANCIVVDETSMLDITLAKHLLEAIKNGAKVIFLGDNKQLASVGPGNVLLDLIKSKIVKIVTLNVIKRQGAESGIVRNANRIINGEMIYTCQDTKDAYVLYRNSCQETLKAIIQSTKRLLLRDEFTLEDIQVLCPQKKGEIGTYYINYIMQKEFNNTQDNSMKILNKKIQVSNGKNGSIENIELYFKKNDKVIHVKNNYEMKWYIKKSGQYIEDTIGITNGECGVIEDIINIKKDKSNINRIIVRYEDKYVFYDNEFNELEHAYALTIHKSQGSQWKAVILPIMYANFSMLDNNLFYTGYTRSEEFNVVIGEASAIEYAIRTHKSRERHTSLLANQSKVA